MNIEERDQKILEWLKQGKRDLDIGKLLVEQGYLEKRPDRNLQMAVGNILQRMRKKGIKIKRGRREKKKLIKENQIITPKLHHITTDSIAAEDISDSFIIIKGHGKALLLEVLKALGV